MKKCIDLSRAVQVNDGLTQTSADGVNMAFDTKYGIMFCAYMTGAHGAYGESRGRISLSYFPAAQPTNLRALDVAVGDDVYCQNILSLGEGAVRVIYEKDSRAECEHYTYYRDFNYLTGVLSNPVRMNVRRADGSVVPLTTKEQFAYLEAHGFYNHEFCRTEQISFGSHTIFDGGDGYHYGVISSFLAEPILYRSADHLATLEFFAICPHVAQYEMDFKFLDGKIYAIFRTDKGEQGTIRCTTSSDGGKTWTQAYELENSIGVRPRLILHNERVLIGYNVENFETENFPPILAPRTQIQLRRWDTEDPNESEIVVDLHSKYGIVNICLVDIKGDCYMAYSCSEIPLECYNGMRRLRGKSAVKYLKLGDLFDHRSANFI